MCAAMTETDSLIFEGGFQTLSVRYVRRSDGNTTGKSWSVRFSTDKPKPEELYDWLASLR